MGPSLQTAVTVWDAQHLTWSPMAQKTFGHDERCLCRMREKERGISLFPRWTREEWAPGNGDT